MKKIRPILLASFFFSIHLALVSYINSSVLQELLTPRGVSIVFALSSALSLFLVFRASRIVKRWGNVGYMVVILSTSAALLLLLGITNGHWISVLVFMLYFALNSLVFYGFDIFLERFSVEGTTGNTRGIYLTLNNLAWVGMPVVVGALEVRYGFGIVYFFAAFAVIAALATIFTTERKFHDSYYQRASLSEILSVFWKKSDVRGSIIINGLLHLFYVWMVIYGPIYLTQTLGMSWQTVGIVFSVMLIPFIMFEYPTGRLADRFSNERELIAGGLLIIGIATIIFSLVGNPGALALALILFLTRVGASIVEAANESYFFKHVTAQDIGLIGVYRDMMPLAYVIGPILAITVLGWSVYAMLFFILGTIMLGGSVFALSLHDIKTKPTEVIDELQEPLAL